MSLNTDSRSETDFINEFLMRLDLGSDPLDVAESSSAIQRAKDESVKKYVLIALNFFEEVKLFAEVPPHDRLVDIKPALHLTFIAIQRAYKDELTANYAKGFFIGLSVGAIGTAAYFKFTKR